MISTESERNLVRMCGGYPRMIERAIEQSEPFHVAEYAYLLAREFSKDYGNGEKITNNPSRLTIIGLVQNRLKQCLDILGINTVVRM
jgi:arginyl-tRNA synthetase